MKRFISIILLLVAVQGFAQEPLDSAFLDAEMEDSVSAMAIKPVEHPEELLQQVLQRLEKDLQQKHSRRDYMLESLLNINSPRALYVYRTYTIEDDNGIGVMEYDRIINKGPLKFEGPYRITVQDSLDIEFTLNIHADLNTNAIRVNGYRSPRFFLRALFNGVKLKKVLKGILEAYEVTAYNIVDNSGRGVYRIHFDERKPKKWEKEVVPFEDEKIKWYIDQQSLRLIQINISQNKPGRRNVYKHVYCEENGCPMLQKFIGVIYKEGKLTSWTGVKLENRDNKN
ncbi:MAG: hypothetical protein IKU02_07285 [Bacteroidaceae bacterium]|nr:hypothetical protein [Bacteroidaceae bacterium]